jgi:hypothetical protein
LQVLELSDDDVTSARNGQKFKFPWGQAGFTRSSRSPLPFFEELQAGLIQISKLKVQSHIQIHQFSLKSTATSVVNKSCKFHSNFLRDLPKFQSFLALDFFLSLKKSVKLIS